jgi:hypothetical protein
VHDFPDRNSGLGQQCHRRLAQLVFGHVCQRLQHERISFNAPCWRRALSLLIGCLFCCLLCRHLDGFNLLTRRSTYHKGAFLRIFYKVLGVKRDSKEIQSMGQFISDFHLKWSMLTSLKYSFQPHVVNILPVNR